MDGVEVLLVGQYAGDLLQAVNGVEVKDTKSLKDALNKAAKQNGYK